MMEVTINDMREDRKPKALLGVFGFLYIRHRENPDTTVVIELDGDPHTMDRSLEDIFDEGEHTPIYEGDEVTIKF